MKQLIRYTASNPRNNSFTNRELFTMLHFKRNGGSISGRIIQAAQYGAVEFFQHRKACFSLINTKIWQGIYKTRITLCLLPCRFSLSAKLPSDTATTKHSDNGTKQPTETTCRKNRSAKNKRYSINESINTAIDCFGHNFKPVATPDTKANFMLSWLFVHQDYSSSSVFFSSGGAGLCKIWKSFVSKSRCTSVCTSSSVLLIEAPFSGGLVMPDALARTTKA
ncbi:hypothetical protein PQA65_gp08 [Yersinia phage vB_YenM_42.18]|uniref:Uncharacterized protein n=1 Tax=Yersinia phage vB_YenM_42.18 TaxID=2918926 RepID=A0AAE9JYC6_9CAUD|nr:hypothetical protein PQA65_gp08 [Yersinia phage vB_YenM_42.18]UNA05722.1 hypothetical protein vBYenM4218_008 [Yersinia phage vB_YenM_42.18]